MSILINSTLFEFNKQYQCNTSYPVFVTFKHTSEVSILVAGASGSEVRKTVDHLIVLLELPRLKYKDNGEDKG